MAAKSLKRLTLCAAAVGALLAAQPALAQVTVATDVSAGELAVPVNKSPVLRTDQPYTRALISAVPVIGSGPERRRMVLTGDVPSPVNLPSGCRFRTRCPYAIEVCSTTMPPLAPVDGRRLACHVDPFAAR